MVSESQEVEVEPSSEYTESEAKEENDSGQTKARSEQNGNGDVKGNQVEEDHVEQISKDVRQNHGINKPDKLQETDQKSVELKLIHTGDPKVRSKLRFEVVKAKVIESGGKKHVAYTIMMKRVGNEQQPAVIERRYNDFCYVYEFILRAFHPSILGDFQFPKKVLLGNFKAEVISERTDAFHKFLNLIANNDNLLYSDHFYSFLSSVEHNEAVSHIKLSRYNVKVLMSRRDHFRYSEAIPLLETIFCVREKLLTIANFHVVIVLCELVACMSAESVGRNVEAYSYALVAMRGFELIRGHPEIEPLWVPFLKIAANIASDLGQDKKQFDRQLSELRYSGEKLFNRRPLLEVVRDRYIHRATHTSKIS